jgi:hypothetical protein
MAVRNDFTAGEVLAAADLNDTFASKVPFSYGTATPSTTVDGFVWYDENETPPALKFWDGAAFQLVSPPSGLVHIATESFSAVSSVSLNGVFTSAYANYLLLIVGSNSASSRPQIRFRVGGVDAATNYNRQGLWGVGSTATAFGSTGNTIGFLTLNQEAGDFGVSAEIFRPAIAVETIFTTVGYTVEQSAELSGQRHTTATAYDGFSVIPESGTITGTIRVYGYQNS